MSYGKFGYFKFFLEMIKIFWYRFRWEMCLFCIIFFFGEILVFVYLGNRFLLRMVFYLEYLCFIIGFVDLTIRILVVYFSYK